MELSFLQTTMLWGLLAASVPFIVHLLAKRPPKRVIFPTMMFLKGAAFKVQTGMKLKRLLLLASRALLLSLLAFIMAQGVISRVFSESNKPTAVIVLIDNSPSMLMDKPGGNLLSKSIETAKSIVRTSKRGSIFSITSLAGAKDFVKDHDSATQLIDQVNQAVSFRDLYGAYKDVISLLSKLPSEQPKKLYILSDFASHNFTRPENTQTLEELEVILVPFGDKITDDRAVLRVEPVSNILVPGVPVSINIHFFSTQDLEAQSYEVSIMGKKVATNSVDLKENQVTVVVVDLLIPDDNDESVFGSVSFISQDAFPMNDQYFFALDGYSGLNVVVLFDETDSENASISRSLAQAIAPPSLGESSPYKVKRFNYFSLPREDLEATDIIFYTSPRAPSMLMQRNLGEWIRNGGVFFLFTSPGIDMRKFAAWCGFEEGVSPMIDTGEAYAVSAFKPQNSITSFFNSGRNGRLDRVLSIKRSDITSFAVNSLVVLQYEDGVPALVCKPVQEGVTNLVNIPLEGDASNFLAKPVFLPLLHEMLKMSSPLARAQKDFEVGGDPISLPSPRNTSSAEIAGLEGKTFPASLDSETRLLIPQVPLDPGGYQVSYSGEKLIKRAFSLNYPPSEMNIQRESAEKLLEIFPNSVLSSTVFSGGLTSSLFLSLNYILLPLMFLLFLIELWLSNSFYKAAEIPVNLSENEDDET